MGRRLSLVFTSADGSGEELHFLTLKAASDRTGMNPSTIYQALETGCSRRAQDGREWFVREEGCEE